MWPYEQLRYRPFDGPEDVALHAYENSSSTACWNALPPGSFEDKADARGAGCDSDLPQVIRKAWREEEKYEMRGGLCESDEALLIPSDDDAVCKERDELF